MTANEVSAFIHTASDGPEAKGYRGKSGTKAMIGKQPISGDKDVNKYFTRGV